MKLSQISRRYFIKNISLLSGGLILACDVGSDHNQDLSKNGNDVFSPNLFVELKSNGDLILTASRSEMGQGVRTSLTSVIADEMNADWSRVTVVQAPGDDAYGNQNTDGSRSIRTIYLPMREMGAMARTMLVTAAAKQWGISEDTCKTEQHYVVRTDTDEKLFYGDLAASARLESPPSKLKLKSPEEFIYIGKGLKSVDVSDFVRGKNKYGLDIKIQDMVFACIKRCPVTFGSIESFDDSDSLKVTGVISTKSIDRIEKPFGALGGIAVIASNTWAAIEGQKRLKVKWNGGENESYSSVEYMNDITANVHKKAKLIKKEGNLHKAFKDADHIVEATYQLPHLVHAPMETPNATAHVHDGICEVWAPVQAPQVTRKEVSDFLGIDLDKVSIHVTFLGGGFGRKSKPDFVLEAVALSKMEQKPVQVIWTREDDIQNSYYHAISAQYMKASLKENLVTGWLHRTAYPSIASTFLPGITHGVGVEFRQGMINTPYEIAHSRFENGAAEAHIRIGWLRSVYNIIHGFSINVFVDELAVESGKDPLDFRLELIGSDREYPSDNEYKLETSKLKNVLRIAAKNAGWGKDLPEGHGMGIAIHYSFYTYVASVVEVSVINNKLKVVNVFTAVDCGTVVNYDTVKSQLEGAVIFGMSLAYYGDISVEDGAIKQSNFHNYQMLRIHEAPNINIEIVKSDELPTGIGEPGVPVIAPAIVNAVYNATGKRYRSLPLKTGERFK